jgi:predicted O-methyltransferase YrrM
MEKMIEDPERYFRGFIPPRDELMLEMEKEAERETIKIVGPVMGALLFILVRAVKAARILELGTATAYSTIYLARACQSPEGRLISIEHDPAMAVRARRNLERAGVQTGVEVRVGGAFEVMATLDEPFDFIFMDIDKEGYKNALPHCARLLKIGGVLVTDNVAFAASREFNREIFRGKEWQVVHLLSFLPGHSPEKDGWSLALRV